LIKGVKQELDRQLKTLSDSEATTSLKENGLMIEVNNIKEGLKLANEIAPEHMELMIDQPFPYLGEIKNAGAIFLGEYTPEPVGDYMAGPNHILPTGGTATYASPLTVDDFIKKSSLIYYNQRKLKAAREDITGLANLEGLTAHARAVDIRFDSELSTREGASDD
jgi:histidinol dehydrogenase